MKMGGSWGEKDISGQRCRKGEVGETSSGGGFGTAC